MKKCIVRGFVEGFDLQGATNSTLVADTATANDENGFLVADGSSGNVFGRDTASSNYQGFTLDNSNGNSLVGNHASANAWIGVLLVSASNNTLQGNVAEANPFVGVYLVSFSDTNSFSANIVRANGVGLGIHRSSGNVSTNNRFLNNVGTHQSWGVFVPIPPTTTDSSATSPRERRRGLHDRLRLIRNPPSTTSPGGR